MGNPHSKGKTVCHFTSLTSIGDDCFELFEIFTEFQGKQFELLWQESRDGFSRSHFQARTLTVSLNADLTLFKSRELEVKSLPSDLGLTLYQFQSSIVVKWQTEILVTVSKSESPLGLFQ
jgi:hypothetical protein